MSVKGLRIIRVGLGLLIFGGRIFGGSIVVFILL